LSAATPAVLSNTLRPTFSPNTRFMVNSARNGAISSAISCSWLSSVERSARSFSNRRTISVALLS
jgi:hypothetical protein